MGFKRKIWTNFELDYLQIHYPNKRSDVIAKELQRSIGSIYSQANLLGLKKSQDFLNSKECGRLTVGHEKGKSTQFKKGQAAANKGKKQTEYMSAESIEKTTATRFKKGNRPHNWKPVGSERKTKDGYIEVKTENPNKWELKSRVEFEKQNPHVKLRKGLNVLFRNGDKLDFSQKNLLLMSDQAMMDKNRITKYPLDLQQVIKLNNKLIKLIKNGKK